MHAAAPTLDAPGLVRFGFPDWETFTSPAAGADFSYTVTGNYFERFVAIHVKLVADANAASREVVVSWERTDGKRFALAGINTTVTASLTAYYEFNAFQPLPVATVDSSALVPLPPILMRPTDVLKIHVVNIQATDQLSEVRGIRERFFTQAQPILGAPQLGG